MVYLKELVLIVAMPFFIYYVFIMCLNDNDVTRTWFKDMIEANQLIFNSRQNVEVSIQH